MSEPNDAERLAPETSEAPEFPGCEGRHSNQLPDPNCDACCNRYGVRTSDLRSRKGLLSQGMLRSRWKPNQSGNPAGRSAGSLTFEEIVARHLDLPADIDPLGNPITYREAIIVGLIEAAMPPAPQRWAVDLILSREWPETRRLDANVQSDRIQIVVDDGERYILGEGFDPRRPTVVLDPQDMLWAPDG